MTQTKDTNQLSNKSGYRVCSCPQGYPYRRLAPGVIGPSLPEVHHYCIYHLCMQGALASSAGTYTGTPFSISVTSHPGAEATVGSLLRSLIVPGEWDIQGVVR